VTLACWITSIRFVLAPFIYVHLSAGTREGLAISSLLLALAGLSDVLDGWVARSRSEVSELGKILDPLTDKMTIFSMLLGMNQSWKLPLWILLAYFVKEVLQIASGVYLFKNFRQLIPANRWGKSSTLGFFLGFLLFFINTAVGITIISVAFLVSVYAFYTYYREYLVLKSHGALKQR